MSYNESVSAMRVGGAGAAAAGAAAAPTILLGPLAVIALPIAFVIAAIHVLLFAIPAYYLLRRKMQVDWAQAIIAGFVIGAMPLTVWAWLTSGGSLLVSAILGVLGMLGGMTFRAIIGPPARRADEAATARVFE